MKILLRYHPYCVHFLDSGSITFPSWWHINSFLRFSSSTSNTTDTRWRYSWSSNITFLSTLWRWRASSRSRILITIFNCYYRAGTKFINYQLVSRKWSKFLNFLPRISSSIFSTARWIRSWPWPWPRSSLFSFFSFFLFLFSFLVCFATFFLQQFFDL